MQFGAVNRFINPNTVAIGAAVATAIGLGVAAKHNIQWSGFRDPASLALSTTCAGFSMKVLAGSVKSYRRYWDIAQRSHFGNGAIGRGEEPLQIPAWTRLLGFLLVTPGNESYAMWRYDIFSGFAVSSVGALGAGAFAALLFN